MTSRVSLRQLPLTRFQARSHGESMFYFHTRQVNPSPPCLYNPCLITGLSIPMSATPPPSYSDTTSSPASSSRSSPKSQPHIPRPRNAFIIFRSHYYMRAKATQTGINQNSLSCAAASAWKALSDEEKRPYRRQAEEEKLIHYRKHPNYVYTPVNKAVKRAQKKARLAACRRPTSQKLRSSLSRRDSYAIFPPSWQASPEMDAFVPLEDIPSLNLALVRCLPWTFSLPPS